MRFVFLTALALIAQGQTVQSAPTPVAPSFLAVGLSCLPQSQPKCTGDLLIATPLSGKVQSVSGLDFSLVNKAVQTTPWTAAAMPLMTPWNTPIYACAGIGATTGANSGYAVTGCAIAAIPTKHGQLIIGPEWFKSSIGGTTVKIVIGWGFKLK